MATPNEILSRLADAKDRLRAALTNGQSTIKVRAEIEQIQVEHDRRHRRNVRRQLDRSAQPWPLGCSRPRSEGL
jgi:hypothetical protein